MNPPAIIVCIHTAPQSYGSETQIYANCQPHLYTSQGLFPIDGKTVYTPQGFFSLEGVETEFYGDFDPNHRNITPDTSFEKRKKPVRLKPQKPRPSTPNNPPNDSCQGQAWCRGRDVTERNICTKNPNERGCPRPQRPRR